MVASYHLSESATFILPATFGCAIFFRVPTTLRKVLESVGHGEVGCRELTIFKA
jgi:hypothetical protein